jgi:NADH-quinone oxidoreductase subunit F
MLEVLTRITRGEGRQGDMEFLEDLCLAVKDASMCGLGTTIPNPVLSTMKYFREEYEAHIIGKKCPALACRSLIRYHILPEKCSGCKLCLKNCPVGAIAGELKHIHVIDQLKCTKCGVCLEVCPPKVSAVVKVSGDDIGKLHVLEKPVPVETFRETH